MNLPVRLIFLLAVLLNPAFAQDERRVVSPDGKVEFFLFINGQEDSNLARVAYQVRVNGNVVVDTSFMGFDIYTWEPLLGENVGLISDKKSSSARYNGLVARYMQNGSLARRLDVEVRAYNDGVAFRYTIGKAVSTERLQIADESTEFDLKHDPGAVLSLPFVTRQKDVGTVALTELPAEGYPRMHLVHEDQAGKILLTRLGRERAPSDVVYDGAPPLTTAWRVLAIGYDAAHLPEAAIMRDLSPARH
jgi:hypothetical protein